MQKLAAVQKSHAQQMNNLVISFRRKTQEFTKNWFVLQCTHVYVIQYLRSWGAYEQQSGKWAFIFITSWNLHVDGLINYLSTRDKTLVHVYTCM